MSFIDWNGNGRIDPADIAISIALDEENSKLDNNEGVPPPEINRKTGHGCLTSVLIFTFFSLLTIFSLVR